MRSQASKGGDVMRRAIASLAHAYQHEGRKHGKARSIVSARFSRAGRGKHL